MLWLCAGEYHGSLTIRAFVRYASARITQYYKDETFRIYVTDALKTLTTNTAKYVGGEYMKMSYKEVVHPKPEETRSAEQIIATIKAKLGGESS